MTLAEKIGQMTQVNGSGGAVPDALQAKLRAGAIGSALNEVEVDIVNELQRIAVEQSRLGILLLIGRASYMAFERRCPFRWDKRRAGIRTWCRGARAWWRPKPLRPV